MIGEAILPVQLKMGIRPLRGCFSWEDRNGLFFDIDINKKSGGHEMTNSYEDLANAMYVFLKYSVRRFI